MKNVFFLTVIIIFSNCQHKPIIDSTLGASCKYEKSVPAINVDESFQIPWCVGGPLPTYIDRYQYLSPSISVNLDDIIAYTKIDFENIGLERWQLWTYDFCSNEHHFLTMNAVGHIDWNKNDWIVFTGFDNQIWKIRSSGTELTRLTNNGVNLYGTWNPDGTKIIYRNQVGSNVIQLIMDEQGNNLDTINEIQVALDFSWEVESKIYFIGNGIAQPVSNPGLWYLDLNTRQLHNIEYLETRDYNTSFLKIVPSKNKLFWSSYLKFGYTSSTSGIRNTLLEGYDNRHYGDFDISRDGKIGVINRIDRTNIDSCSIDNKNSLYLIDMETEEERKIILPE